jgi:phospholipase/lecithinase/hemolysin
MRIYIRSKILIIPLLFCITFLAYAENSYRNVFIFGDSLSDTGNLASLIGPLPAPYYQNRVSNGPLAVDILTEKLGTDADPSLHLVGLNSGSNYAVAGAKASGNEPVDLDTQLLSFKVNHGYVAPADALYVILIGGNDIRSALYEEDNTAASLIINTANTKIKNLVKSLHEIGAKSFLVLNAPNIALLPETQLMAVETNNTELVNRAYRITRLFNKKLEKTVDQLKEETAAHIIEFNLFKLFNKIVANAIDELDFINNTDACFSSVTYTYHPDCNYGLNADKFVFFDEIHPTAKVHALFGNAFYKKIKEE